ncbi:MAG: cytochrome c-type protein NapB [Alphaproteobacteria bacterium]|jgi:cytochrome c-type protein NapB
MRSKGYSGMSAVLNRDRDAMKVCVTVAFFAAAFFVFALSNTVAADPIATLRGGEISETLPAPVMAKPSEETLRRVRNYPEQPPTIPHKIKGYQIDLNAYKCLSCHSRVAVGQSQAPMVSVTHFMDRDGQVLGSVTPRRYFCNQCHIPQLKVKPLVENTFVDVDSVLGKEK